MPVAARMAALLERVGRTAYVDACCELLAGAPREEHLDVLPWLTNADWAEGSPVRDPASWEDYWRRHRGARGLLHGLGRPGDADGRGGLRRPARATGRDLPDGGGRARGRGSRGRSGGADGERAGAGTGPGGAGARGGRRRRARLGAGKGCGTTRTVGVRRAAEAAWAALAERLDLDPGRAR